MELIPESRQLYLLHIYYNVLYIEHPSNKFEEVEKLFEIILPKMQWMLIQNNKIIILTKVKPLLHL